MSTAAAAGLDPGGAGRARGLAGVPGLELEYRQRLLALRSSRRTAMEVDYLQGFGLITDDEACRRRYSAYALFEAARADLRAWLAVTGC